MKQTVRYLLCGVLVCLQLFVLSQNEAKKWYFGWGTGLDFSTVPPSTIAVSSMSTQEGCASIADANGNLLFYTNGVTIWDRTHGIMANGTGLLGSTLSSQSSLILQQPGSAVLYYVFTNVGFNIANVPNVNFSIVDMSLATGNGSVVTKNAVLSSDQNTEVLTATRHCNGIDWWIVTHIRNSNVYLSYLLTATGISPSFVVSPTGPTISSGFSQLKISPNGRKTALSFNGVVYLGDFDASTGQVTNVVSIQNSAAGYGCEFSPDGTKLYASASNGIMQYNLCAGNSVAIAASGFMVHSQTASFGSMQLAPNGKIYLSYNTFTTSCHVINNPNLSGISCNYQAGSNLFLPKQIHAGLPNFSGSLFYQRPTLSPYFYQVSSGYGCYGAYFNALLFANSCAAVSNSLAMLVWDFDDPLSGANNISYLTSPIHNFSGNGTYNVKLILHYSCAFPSDTITQQVVINDNCLSYASSSITCASLGSATVTSATGTGPFTYTWLPQNQTGVIANSLTPGSHTVVITDISNNYTYSVPITLPSLSPYTASIFPTASVTCNGGSNGAGAITNVAGGSGQQTYAWASGTVLVSAQSPTNLFAGTWSVSVTDNLTACKVNSLVTILQPPPLTLTPISSSPSVCVSHSLTLTAAMAGGVAPPLNAYTYTWVNGPSTASNVITETVSGNYIYTVSGKDANNCTTSSTIGINVVTNPSITVSNVSICPQAYGVLMPTGASTYTWYAASTSSVGTNYSDNPAVSTQYTVLGSALGCTNTATASIILYAVPVPSLQSTTPICSGGNFTLSGLGGASYQWSGPSTYVSSQATNVFTNISALQGGLYSSTVTSANGCTAVATTSIVVNTPPVVSTVGSTVCTTQTITVNASSSAGASYFWMGPQGFSSSNQNASIANPSTLRAGTYTVIVTAVDGCTNTGIASVNVVSPPVLFTSLGSNTMCAQAHNGSANSATLAMAGASSYTLHVPAGIASTLIPNGFAITTQAPFQTTTTAVTVTLEGSNGVCSSFAPKTITVIPNPVLLLTSVVPTICAGQNFSFSCNGASSYTWLPNGFNYSINGGGSSIVSQPTVNAVYSVMGTSVGCISATQSATAIVFAVPTITLSTRSTSICLNNTSTLSVRGTGTAYLWQPGLGLNTSTGTLVTCGTLSNQVYTVIASANTCTSSITSSVHVWPLPTPTITNEKGSVCLGDSIALSGSGGFIYQWKAPDNTTIFGQHVKFFAVSPAMGGSYTLSVLDSNACGSKITTAIQVLALPSGELPNFAEKACVPFCAPLNFVANNNRKVTATWLVNGQPVNSNTLPYCYTAAGNYTLRGTIVEEGTGCKASVSYNFVGYQKPKANFSYSPATPLELLDEVSFVSTSESESSLRYQWYIDDDLAFLSSAKTAEHVFANTGDYRVALVIRDSHTCADTLVKTVHVDEDFGLFVPNTFTPNNDNLNDHFKVSIRSAKQFQLKVYDRWGQEVFYSKSAEEGWDGTFRGDDCKQDTYTWTIDVSTKAGQHLVRSGTVLLLRGR